MADPRSSNMTTRGSAKGHDHEQGREEVKRSKTSSDDSNSTRGTVRTRDDEEIGEETKKPKLRCLNLCDFAFQTWRASSSRTTRCLLSPAAKARERYGNTSTRQNEVLH